jgi:hypothetical protein
LPPAPTIELPDEPALAAPATLEPLAPATFPDESPFGPAAEVPHSAVPNRPIDTNVSSPRDRDARAKTVQNQSLENLPRRVHARSSRIIPSYCVRALIPFVDARAPLRLKGPHSARSAHIDFW